MIAVKSCQRPIIWKKLNHKKFKSLVYGFGGRCLKIRRVQVWIMNHVSRSIALSLFILKASNWIKWPISPWSFIWWCQVIDYLKFESLPSSLRNFAMANRVQLKFWNNFMFSEICSGYWLVYRQGQFSNSEKKHMITVTKSWTKLITP